MIPNGLLLFLFFQVICLYPVVAQQAPADTATDHLALQSTLQLYQNTMGGFSALYNGGEYTGSYPGTAGHPYFLQDTLQPGTLTYDDVFYPAVSLNYNLVSNEVIIKGKQNLAISLVPEKIESFTIQGHAFVAIKEDSSAGKIGIGYYEMLYDGAAKVLARRIKKVERGNRVEDPMLFKPYNRYVVEKNGAYYPADSQKEVLALCSDKKDVMKQYLRQAKLNFKKEMEQSLVQAIMYYDQLKN